MREEIITFKTAKLAKEKGFNVEVTHCYGGDYNDRYELKEYNSLCTGNNGEMIHRMTGDSEYLWLCKTDFNNDGFDSYSAPTQSLLQKWLREKHKIHITIGPWFGRDEHFRFTIEPICIIGEFTFEDISEEDFESYEEALEKALQEALKLIKND